MTDQYNRFCLFLFIGWTLTAWVSFFYGTTEQTLIALLFMLRIMDTLGVGP